MTDAPAGRYAAGLVEAGMSEQEARHKGEALRRLVSTVRSGNHRVHALWVPGRIELLGKHTDYAGGRSLLAALECGISMAVAARDDRIVRMLDRRSGARAELTLHPGLEPTMGQWSNYPVTVVRRMARDFGPSLRGATILFESDLPSAAGMSSSSALVVATFLAVSIANDLPSRAAYQTHIPSREALASYLAAVESGESFGPFAGDTGVGTEGGSQDHTAILCAVPGHAVQYAFRPVRLERVIQLPPGRVLIIAASGVAASKTGAARDRYNDASRRARAIVDRWRVATGGSETTLAAIVASAADATDRLRALLVDEPVSLARLDQFVAESVEIIPAAGDALAAGDLAAFGALVDRSQDGAERLLGNQVNETIDLARDARTLGASAASAFGAGFGGSVWAMVEASSAGEFCVRWRDAYARRHPESSRRAEFFVTRAGPAAVAPIEDG